MVSKKEALILGAVVIGGFGLASMMSEGDGDGGAGGLTPPSPRAGGILGSYGGAPTGGVEGYSIPAQAAVTFPEPIDYSEWMKSFMAPTEPGKTPDRGGAGVSSAGKKVPIYSSLETGIGYGVMPSGKVGFAPTPGYIEDVGYGVGVYPISESKKTAVPTEKYSFWRHLYASTRGKEEAYTSQYDYVKGVGMMPKKAVSNGGGGRAPSLSHTTTGRATAGRTPGHWRKENLAKKRSSGGGGSGSSSSSKGMSGTATPGGGYTYD